jgi:hypothetical protein
MTHSSGVGALAQGPTGTGRNLNVGLCCEQNNEARETAGGARRLHDGNQCQQLTRRKIKAHALLDNHEPLTRAAAQNQIDATQRETEKKTRPLRQPVAVRNC